MAERRFRRIGASPLVVAHRGASRERPENTLAAFDAAIAAGADAVEFDVRITADGHAVVMHDPSVDRTTDGTGLVRDLSLEAVRRLRVGSGTDGDARVPTLAETLAALSGRAAIDVELKQLPGEPDHVAGAEPVAEAVVRILAESRFDGPVLVTSFAPGAIARVRELDADLPTGLLSIEAMPATDAIALARDAGHAWALPPAAAVLAGGRSLVEHAHDAGVLIGTWVVDDPRDAASLSAWGVDAIATNDPAGVAAALAGGAA